jgi:crossover junction endodeoxyribonuclease RuvC
MKIKMALTGNGNASKEQVAGMLQRLLKIPQEEMSKFMDATDALAAAYCHFMQAGKPESDVKYRGWKDFVNKNKERINNNGRTQKDTEKIIRESPCHSDAKDKSEDEDD